MTFVPWTGKAGTYQQNPLEVCLFKLTGSDALVHIVITAGLRGQDGLRGRLFELPLILTDLDIRDGVGDFRPRRDHHRRWSYC